MIELPFSFKRPIDGCALKIIAVVCMIIDHYAAIVLSEQSQFYIPMRCIGRLAFPIFAFLVVEGVRHTKDIKKYALRMFILALVSELPFDFAHIKSLDELSDLSFIDFGRQNVFFTLFLGVLMLWALSYVKYNPTLTFAAVCVPALLAYFLKSDYKAAGIAIIFGFYIMTVTPLAGMLIVSAVLGFCFKGHVEPWGILALVPILLYNGKRGHQIKYLFYAVYPLLYIILGIINLFNLRNAS